MNTEDRLLEILDSLVPGNVHADRQSRIEGLPAIVYYQIGSTDYPVQRAYQPRSALFNIDIRVKSTEEGRKERRDLDREILEKLRFGLDGYKSKYDHDGNPNPEYGRNSDSSRGLLINSGTARTMGDDLEGTDHALRLIRTVELRWYE